MDYIFASSIVGLGLRMVTISYDVGCQWYTHFWKREKFLPAYLRLTMERMSLSVMVPKFHLASHEIACHGPYSFNFTRGAGRTDGEGVERNWRGLNGQAPSTSEMGAGNRQDTLDDCCGWSNWRKLMGMGAFSSCCTASLTLTIFLQVICS